MFPDDRRPFAASHRMSAPSLPALICPSCRTRLRVAREQAGSARPCPECGQSLLVSRDLLQVLVVPSAVAIPSRQPTPLRLFIVASGIVVVVVTFALWPRERVVEPPESPSKLVSEPSHAQPEQHSAEVEQQAKPVVKVPRDAALPATPQQPRNVDPLPPQPVMLQPQQVAMEAPPESEMRTPALVQDAAVIPVNAEQAAAKTTSPPPTSSRELIDTALRQRFVSFQVSGKTPLRQLVRELNELANGFIVISPQVSSATLDKTVAVSLKDTSLSDVLSAVAKASGLKVVVAEDRIELGP